MAATALAVNGLATAAPLAAAAIDACATPTGAATYEDPNGGTATVTIAATDPTTCRRTYQLARIGGTDTIVEAAGDPIVRTGSALLDAMYAMAVEEAHEDSTDAVTDGDYDNNNPQNCSADGKGCYYTGKNWKYVWTRDVSYSAALGLTAVDPVRMRNTLAFKLSERRSGYWDDLNADGTPGRDLQIIQDSGTGGSYPNSTDRVSWSLGAEEIINWLPDSFRQAFTDRAYEAVRNTIEHDRQVIFDTTHGLYTGETSFLDWRWQTYPQWIGLDMTQIAQSMSLSTNVTHWVAIDQAARLAVQAGDGERGAKYRAWADDLAESIRSKFWLEDRSQFSAVLTGTLDPAPVERYDALGTALVILTGIATSEQASKAIASYPQSVSGPPTIWPQQPTIPTGTYQPQSQTSYHNEGAWPFVTAFMLLAASRVGNDTAAAAQVSAMVRTPALYGSNYENVNIMDGGLGTAMNSERQLWSVAGMLGMYQRSFFGIEAQSDGITINPRLTAQTRTKYFGTSESIILDGIGYRGRTIDVEVKLPVGSSADGFYPLVGTTVNGTSVPPGQTLTPATLGAEGSRVSVVVTLGTPASSVAAAAQTPVDVSNHEQVYAPEDPSLNSVTRSGQDIILSIGLGGTPSDAVSMDVLRDGELIVDDIPAATTYTDAVPALGRNSYCYSVRLTFRSSRNTSQPSNSKCYWGSDDERIIVRDSSTFQHTGGEVGTKTIEGRARTYLKNWGNGKTDTLTSTVTAPATGTYWAQVQYSATASRSVTHGVSSGIKMMTVIDKATNAVVARKPLVLSNRATWDAINGSTYLPVDLLGGHTYDLVLSTDRLAVNMGFFEANARYSRSDENLYSAPVGANDIWEMRLYLKEAADLSVTSAGNHSLDAGQVLSTTLATASSGLANDADAFTATIAWGDGATSTAVVNQVTAGGPSGAGSFSIGGSHTYKTAGTYAGVVTVSDGTDTSTSTFSVTVRRTDVLSSNPAITGTARVGGKLTAVPGTWEPGAALAYAWFANGAAVPGASRRSLSIGANLAGKRISVSVTGTLTGKSPITRTSKATTAIAKGLLAKPSVVIKGSKKPGKKLRASAKRTSAGRVTYQWYVGKKKVSKASAVKVKKAWRGKKVRVAINVTKPGYVTATATSTTVKIKKAAKR
ncbi:hypothetical protein GCM10010401_11380 [Rarobacter faecitabidus]|uniref:Glycogen debranching enzyme C-terminal domain-containing protein n=1 Tax=Rarobacter faecitabidus TaxID=13243 RepID=A0A542ZP43_RARFA|nr:amylo-alpha-1,6-glucosidase [Rarobacter faecitabidus]TQL62122.1 hypothetical protein FB461_1759 [Rarobacter faecitabidus]